ncbi:MAG: succinate dehydrogenase cytochrome b subunit [Flavobacteriales bacterium]|nr:succinate dehydrogenase cytochrome b subunit [Flavobacteriales bacterium]
MVALIRTSVARKYAMALSGFFLLFFLLQHLTINFTSILSAETFNFLSHFMGTNPFVQYALQPVLAFGVFFHIAMGIVLELQNRAARDLNYSYSNPAASSTWMSRNMIITGIAVLLFLGLHFYDFWFPELKLKFIDGVWNIEDRYFSELQHKFADPLRTALYVLSFGFLALHLLHGFQSAFQSVGFRNNKYTPTVKLLANIYGVAVPLGFIVVALYHYFGSLTH